ncbi:MAG TPA: hypothetical protein VG477_05365, partial [Thermoanaerobaculia bacterium]|nr:hypothetical protein [Thermoanaerobaculia bacterium]
MRRSRLVFCTLLAALAGALPGPAVELTPRGPEFVVNQHTEGFQSTPDLASLGTAGMVAVWTENDQGPGGIKARLLDTAGKPVSDELWVEQGPAALGPARVAGNGNGLYAVVWGGTSHSVWARLFHRGQPLGGTFQINPVTAVPRSYAIPDVGMDAAGNFTVTWLKQVSSQEHQILARRFGPDGQPLGEPLQVNQSRILGVESLIDLRIAVHADGGFAVTWNAFGTGPRLRRFNGPSQTWEGEVSIPAPVDFMVPVLYPEGDGAVVWLETLGNQIKARRFDTAGRLVGSTILVGFYQDPGLSGPHAAVDKAGNTLVVWPGSEGILGRLFDRSWQPLGEDELISLGEFDETEPTVEASPAGGFVAAWTTGSMLYGFFPGLPPGPSTGRDGDLLGIAARGIAGVCSADAETLCLGPGGRFAARVTLRNPVTGLEGKGQPLALTRDTGAFWFFGSENLELMVKVLDGRGVNGSFWVYLAALSDVEYTLVITDTVTGAEKSYRNPFRQLASLADVDAFPAAGAPSPDPSPALGAAEALLLG